MPFLFLKDKKSFFILLKIFHEKNQVTFNINLSEMIISSPESPNFHLLIPNTFYQIDKPFEFTINIEDLISNINLLDTNLVFLSNSFKIFKLNEINTNAIISNLPEPDSYDISEISKSFNRINEPSTISTLNKDIIPIIDNKLDDIIFQNSINDYSYIDIPLINPIKSFYKEINSPSVRCFVDKHSLRYFLLGNVVYSIEDSFLVMTKDEESVKVEVDFLNKRILSFKCSNNWLKYINKHLEYISKVWFCFSEDLFSIKILFHKLKNVILEIQIFEKISVNY